MEHNSATRGCEAQKTRWVLLHREAQQTTPLACHLACCLGRARCRRHGHPRPSPFHIIAGAGVGGRHLRSLNRHQHWSVGWVWEKRWWVGGLKGGARAGGGRPEAAAAAAASACGGAVSTGCLPARPPSTSRAYSEQQQPQQPRQRHHRAAAAPAAAVAAAAPRAAAAAALAAAAAVAAAAAAAAPARTSRPGLVTLAGETHAAEHAGHLPLRLLCSGACWCRRRSACLPCWVAALSGRAGTCACASTKVPLAASC